MRETVTEAVQCIMNVALQISMAWFVGKQV